MLQISYTGGEGGKICITTSESNVNLIKRLFEDDPLIQNPTNSPDLAYQIGILLGYIKP